MEHNLLPIGKVAKLFHISISSLRHYENIGLLVPQYISESGYRYYGPNQFEVLNTIRYLRALDMPLSDIQDFLKNREINLIQEKLLQQKQEVLNKQQELKRIEKKIDHRLNWLHDALNSTLDTVNLITLPKCKVVWVDEPLKIDGSNDMEAPIRKLDQQSSEATIFLGKVGLGISIQHLKENNVQIYDGIFLILDQEDNYQGKTLTLPTTLAVQIRFKGSHNQSKQQYRKLLNYITNHKLEIIGFSREITLIDYGITNDINQFVTEICIPVKG